MRLLTSSDDIDVLKSLGQYKYFENKRGRILLHEMQPLSVVI